MTKPTDWRKTCAELIEDVCYLIDCVDHDCCDPVALMECREHLSQTRAALAQPEPEGPSYRDVLALRDELDADGYGTVDLVAFAHAILARWARPTIEPPAELRSGHERFAYGNGYADGWTAGRSSRPTIKPVPVAEDVPHEEILRLAAKEIGYEFTGQWFLTGGKGLTLETNPLELLNFAHAILARWGHPTTEPVPVAERPWEREGWCDAEGRCWWFNHAGIPEWQLASDGPYGDFSLPHHALPVPGAEGSP
jgi:hypothetical protein